MKIAIILNGISFQKSLFFKRILPLLQASYPVETFETLSRHDAINLASKAVDKGFDVILAAGGDGTVHQVLNGILKGNETLARLPVLGVLPIGTGNDFARSVLRSVAYHETLNLLAAKESNTIDIGRITFTTETGEKDSRYFVNVVDTGMGPEVVQKVLNSGRPFGSALAYYSSILSTFFTYKPVTLTAITTHWQWKSKMKTFAIGNGKYYGNGLCIAPEAVLTDGVLDIFACGNTSALDFILNTIPLKTGKKVKHREVSYYKAEKADQKCVIEADGEILGYLPATIEVLPKRISFLMKNPGQQ